MQYNSFRNILLALIFTTSYFGDINAQALNDDCFSAIQLPNVQNWCSSGSQFNNFSALESGYGPATCFSQGGHDVWYSFTAIASDITILIKPGTMKKPEAALYIGECNSVINELECQTNLSQGGVLQLYQGGLFPGNVYFLRVQGEDDSEGSFDICLDNYFPPVNPGSDCNTASILCSKDPFVVQIVEGVGSVKKEFDDAPCLADPQLSQESETNSTWFKWTCDTSGTFTFSLTPLNATDDLDFAVYELNGPISTCTRTILRCEAASCEGPTGLREGANDISEPPNCDSGQDNWLAPMMLEKGKSYMLGVNNFSNTGNGFRIEFGGTSTFEGPIVDFDLIIDSTTCREEEITIVDKSKINVGSIDQVHWIFGQDATPTESNVPGNQTVSWLKRGQKVAVLTVTSDKGCIVSKAKPLEVLCCGPNHDIKVERDTTISLGDSVDIEATAVLEGNNIFYFWQPPGIIKCQGCPQTNIKTFVDQQIIVTATDEFNCEARDTIEIRVDAQRPFFFPNVFSPNFDGINDGFTGFGTYVAKKIDYLRIYNRWGACVFERKDFAPNDELLGWDGLFKGQELPPDVFVYLAKVTFIDDVTVIYKGSVTIVK